MSYLEKIKNINDKKKINKAKNEFSNWVILPLKKKREDKREREEEIENQMSEEKKEGNYISYEEEFYIKYGSEILEFYLEMKKECDDKMYNILNKNRNSNYISSEFSEFLLYNTNMKEEVEEEVEEKNEYLEENNSL